MNNVEDEIWRFLLWCCWDSGFVWCDTWSLYWLFLIFWRNVGSVSKFWDPLTHQHIPEDLNPHSCGWLLVTKEFLKMCSISQMGKLSKE